MNPSPNGVRPLGIPDRVPDPAGSYGKGAGSLARKNEPCVLSKHYLEG
jgi:hypothetical protein